MAIQAGPLRDPAGYLNLFAGDGLLDGERQHGGGPLAVFIGLARRRIDHANQTGCGSRTDAGLVAPVFDAATVLRTPVAGDHSPDTPRAQRDAEHDADNPEHETSSGSESLLVEPALLLLIFVLFQVLEMIAGSLAGDALGFGGIERHCGCCRPGTCSCRRCCAWFPKCARCAAMPMRFCR